MTADGCVNTAGAAPLVLADDLVVQLFAHSVQPLVLPFVAAAGADGDLGNGGQRVRVVRGERRVESRRVGEEASGAGQVRDVARHLARKHGVVGEAALLRHLDFGVPIGAFAQADHQPPVGAVRQVGEPVDDRQRPLLVGLDGEPEAVPAGKFGVDGQRLDQVER